MGDCWSRLNELFKYGFCISSEYSGFWCFEYIWKELAAHIPGQHHDSLEFYRACDFNSMALLAMTECEAEFMAHHNFMDILDRVKPSHLREIMSRVPSPMQNKDIPASKKAEMEKQYEDMGAWLAEHRAEVFPCDAKATCKSCSQQCFIRPPGLREGHCGSKSSGELQPLQVACAGSTCVGWSSMGKRLGRADPAMLPYLVWREERLAVLEDIVFHENSGRFPYREMLENPCKDEYESHTIVLGSNELGYPFMRRRALTVMSRRSTLVWVGPGTQEETASAFYSFFRRSVCARGEDYMVDTPEHVVDELKDMCSKKGFVYSGATDEEVIEHIQLTHLMSPSQLSHYKAAVRWAEMHEEYDGHLMVDCDQNPQVRQPSGEKALFMPQLLTHGLVVSQRFQRPCTRRELLAVMGVALDGGPFKESLGMMISLGIWDDAKCGAEDMTKKSSCTGAPALVRNQNGQARLKPWKRVGGLVLH